MSRTTAPAHAAGLPADPVFKAIAAYKALYQQGLDWPEENADGFDAHSEITVAAMYEALKVTPATVRGMVAYLAFVESFETFRGVGMQDKDIALVCGTVRQFVLAQASATPAERIEAALAEIKAALAELYPDHHVTGHASLRASTGAVVAGASLIEEEEARVHFHVRDEG